MNVSNFPTDNQKLYRLLARAIVCLLLPFLLGNSLKAQAEPPAPTQNQESPKLTNAPVLDRQEVDFGNRSVIFDRIATPHLKPEPAQAPIQELPQTTPSAADQPPIQNQATRGYQFLFVSCVAVEGTGLTQVRLQDQGKEVLFWSTIDFHQLTSRDFSTEKSDYSIMSMVSDMTQAEVQAGNAQVNQRGLSPSYLISIPKAQDLSSSGGKSAYLVVSVDPVSAEIRQALEDLHRFYDGHREQLAADYQKAEATRIAQENWLKQNPPQPKDTVIQYFPIHSSQASDSAAKAQNP